jgi:type 1 glutamine amidotransferase
MEDTSTRMLPRPWRRIDEWYAFRSNPRPDVEVLAHMDDAQMGASGMGGDHPIAWKREISRGRSWYTGMGHTIESFSEPLLLDHLRGGIEWAAGIGSR